MSAENPYQAPQTALTTSALPIKLQQIIPWEEDGRRALQEVAKHHRWMMRLYVVLLFLFCCSLILKFFAGHPELAASLQEIPGAVVFLGLITQVFQLAKRLNESWTPLISLLVMFLLPFSLVVPIFYHRRTVKFFAQFDIRIGLLGITPAQLDTRIDTNYDAYFAKAQQSLSAAVHTP